MGLESIQEQEIKDTRLKPAPSITMEGSASSGLATHSQDFYTSIFGYAPANNTGIGFTSFNYEEEIDNLIKAENPDYNPDNWWSRNFRSDELNDVRLAYKIKKCEELYGEAYDISNMSASQKKELENELDVVLYGALYGAKRKGITLDEYIATVDRNERIADKFSGAMRYAEDNHEALENNAALRRIVETNKFIYDLYSYVKNGQIEGVDTSGINSVEDLLKSPDYMSIEYEYLATIKDHSCLSDIENEKCKRLEYIQNLLDFAKSGNVQGFDVSGINSLSDLVKSPQYYNIEYQYLQAKQANGELNEQEQGELEVLDMLAKLYNGDLTNVRMSEFGDGSYCEEFRNCNFLQRTINKISGNNLENKIRNDLSGLSKEDQQARIFEILQTAKDKREAWLLLTALVKLEKEGLIDAEAFNNAAEDAGNSIHVRGAAATDGSEELQELATRDICQEIEKGAEGAFTPEQKEELPTLVAGYKHPAERIGDLAETGDEAIMKGLPDGIGRIIEGGNDEDIAQIPRIFDKIPETERGGLVEKTGTLLEDHPEILEQIGLTHSGASNNTNSTAQTQYSGVAEASTVSYTNVVANTQNAVNMFSNRVSEISTTDSKPRSFREFLASLSAFEHMNFTNFVRYLRSLRAKNEAAETQTTESDNSNSLSIEGKSIQEITKMFNETTSTADKQDIVKQMVSNPVLFEQFANNNLQALWNVAQKMPEARQKTLDIMKRQSYIVEVGNLYDKIKEENNMNMV